MSFLKYYGRVLYVACTHTFHAAHTILMSIILVAGVLTYFVPRFRGGIDIDDQKLMVIIVGATVSIRLFLAPYWIFSKQKGELDSQRSQLDRISEDRPLRFLDVSPDVVGNNFQSRPIWTITRMRIEFENLGDRMLKCTMTDLYFEHDGNKRIVRLDSAATKFAHPRQAMSYEFPITDLSVQKFPVIIIVGFNVEYDNSAPLKIRGMRRVIEKRYLSFMPIHGSYFMREEVEY